jgi:hypothetical protein
MKQAIVLTMILLLWACPAGAGDITTPYSHAFGEHVFVCDANGRKVSATYPLYVGLAASSVTITTKDANALYELVLIGRDANDAATTLTAIKIDTGRIVDEANAVAAAQRSGNVAANADANIIQARLDSVIAKMIGLQVQVAEANDGSAFTDVVLISAAGAYRTLKASTGDGKTMYLAGGTLGVDNDGGRIDILSIPANGGDANLLATDANYLRWSHKWPTASGVHMANNLRLAGCHGMAMDANSAMILHVVDANADAALKIGVK